MISVLFSVLSFLTSSVGRIVMVGVIALGVGWFSRGRLDHSLALSREVNALRLNLENTQAVADAAGKRAEAEAAQETVLQKKVHAYAIALSKRPKAAACRATPFDARRLSGIY